MKQKVIRIADDYIALHDWLNERHVSKLLLVSGKSSKKQPLYRHLEGYCHSNGITIVNFTDYKPNPEYSSVVKGVALFRKEECDAIMAIGGGSAMDVAKCIKLYFAMPGDGEDGSFLKQELVDNSVPFLAVPTTAGTGSEATRYAVVYYEGNKQSVTSSNCIPDTVLLDPSLLKTLSLYQRKATMMDAFSHAIESFWSVNSTEESKQYSRIAIEGILNNYQGYLDNTETGNAALLNAAYWAGRAINITQTTAGHAMCYKLTSMYGYSHGHSAALCNQVLFPWLLNNTFRCCDPRGEQYLKDTLDDLSKVLGYENAQLAASGFSRFVDSLGFDMPIASKSELNELVESVNPLRLKNFPIMLDNNSIRELYLQMMKGQ